MRLQFSTLSGIFISDKGWADVNSRDMLGLTPLHKIVAKEETWEAAGELLKAGADRCAISNDGKFPHDMVPDGPWAETKRSLIRFYMA